MSLYPIIWAAEHAPVYDAEERAILTALAIKGDFDGCNCFRSRPTLAKVARVDPKTVDRKLAEMARRGLIRRQPGPKPAAWLKLPRDKRTVVWEVLIPCEFWSAVQLEEINTSRAERGRPAITTTNRPSIAPAPPKKARADKGKARPNAKRGDSKSSRSNASEGTASPVAPGLQVQSRGDFKSTNHQLVPPDKPSSSYVTRTPQDSNVTTSQEEEESSTKNDKLAAADALVDEVVGKWDTQHRRPTAAERRRMVVRIDQALAGGASPEGVVYTLTRDLDPGQVKTTAVQVVTSRTRAPGWVEDPPEAATRPALPARCDDPRHTAPNPYNRFLDTPDGGIPCPRCHPSMLNGAS